jgi:hypothetical protein
MNKESSIKIRVKMDENSIRAIEAFAMAAKNAQDAADILLGNITTETGKEPEIRIIEQGAIPAAYYYRDSVIEAIRQEIIKDHKAGQPIPPGVELINNEEDSQNGETEKISDPENDSTKRGDGSEPSPDGSNDGDQNSRGGASDPGDTAKDSPETGPGKKAPGEK